METYWHFARCDEHGIPRLAHGDGRAIVVGETLAIDCEPIMCERGLHASKRIFDALHALQYTPAHYGMIVICQVSLSGAIIHGDDKSVATERTVLAMLDSQRSEQILRKFARWCALDVIHLWDPPNIVRRYLETGDEVLRDAASVAARDAAWDAARAASWDAARAAARDAAWDAARAAARDAASAAAWAAARAAARDAASAAARAAVRAAARDAACDAACDAYNQKLTEMVEAELSHA